MNFRRFLVALVALTAIALGASHTAFAGGGNYEIDGGTPFERVQVEKALNASAFNWSMVPGQVTIHIKPGIGGAYSTHGQIWLDANVLDQGTFSWGVVQMEYAQQVQLSLVTDASLQAQLTSLLGGRQWCYDNPYLPRGANACERFAATLAWAYWPSAQNSMQPAGRDDWSAAMDAAAFRALLHTTIGAPNSISTVQPAAGPRVLAVDHRQVQTQTKRRADGSLLLTLSVPGAGVATVSGRGIVRASGRANGAGSLSVWLRPTKQLRPGVTRTVTLTVTFTAADGSSFTAQQTVTLGR